MPQFSGPFRVMQRPELKTEAEVDGGRARVHWDVVRRKKKEKRQRGRMRSELMALFIRLEG